LRAARRDVERFVRAARRDVERGQRDGMLSDTEDRPAVLVVTMGTDYVAPSRMPAELQRAGLHVALLAPHDSFAARTAYADRIDRFPGAVRLDEWLARLAEAARAAAARIVLPGDDTTVRTMMQAVLDPPRDVPVEALRAVTPLIVDSLGDPAHWLDTVDKTRLLRFAQRHGLPVAEGGVADEADEACALATGLGYPVMLRPAFGTAGRGAARCDSERELRAAMRAAGDDASVAADSWRTAGGHRYVVQRWLDGDVVNRASLAWKGAEVAGFTRGRLATHPGPLGPASVVRFVGLPAVRTATERLFALTAMHGLVGTQFIVERSTGIPYLVEVNRRMLPATHSGSLVGIDLAAALATTLRGVPWTGPRDLAEGPGMRLALFPQEWYRDHGSAWLHTLPTDAPWHDPDLFLAMLRLPFDQAAVPERTLYNKTIPD
jgi:hypothetical protein